MPIVREPALLPGVPEPLDLELLAWGAGFFDGEGTTIARADRRRPAYFQLDVSVPQSGPEGVPEILLKFQRAMLGVGNIYPQPNGVMYKWRASGRIAAELTLALMWRWLGPVKRAQAQVAFDAVDRQYSEGRYRARVPRNHPTLVPHEPVTCTDSRRVELAWAAGFLDAEGYFGLPKRYQRSDGSSGFVTRASATQHGVPGVPAEVLTKLNRTLGLGRIERHGEPDDFKWVAEGVVNVSAVLEMVRPWLGPVKTSQAVAALMTAESSRLRGDAKRCVRGHSYDRVYVRPDGSIHHVCKACERVNERLKRAASGSKQRRLRNPSTDPSHVYAN
jgi:hypothetical protein